MSKCPSSTRRQDSNPQPSEHESSPITTRPGVDQSSNSDQIINNSPGLYAIMVVGGSLQNLSF